MLNELITTTFRTRGRGREINNNNFNLMKKKMK